MSDLLLDANGDLDTTGGQLSLVSGVAAIGQHIKIRLRFLQGEWFLDTRLGVPWLQKILGFKGDRTPVWRGILRRAIAETPGVLSVDELTLSEADRVLSVTARVTTNDGQNLDFTEEFIL